MRDPLDPENTRLQNRLNKFRHYAFLIVTGERALAAFWRLFFWFLLFGALWLFALPETLKMEKPVWLVFAAGVLFFLWQDARRLRFPARRDLDRRLEMESGLAHRPVSSLDDTLANAEKPETRGLWLAGKAWAIERLRNLRGPAFRETLAAKDPYAIRLLILLAFCAGLFAAGAQSGERLLQGLKPPVFFAAENKNGDSINIWITPPDYTNAKQIVLNERAPKEKFKIPEGSTIKVRASGGVGTPYLNSIPLKKLGAGNYGYEGTVPNGTKLSIKQLLIPRASWEYEIIPDEPPVLAMDGEPQVLENGQIRFPLAAYDDYGAQSLEMTMRLSEGAQNAPEGENANETRALISPAGEIYKTFPVYDLTGHPWAGYKVAFEFVLKDHKGQKGTLPAIEMTLPERHFRHPVSQALAAMRKELLADAEANAPRISNQIEEIMVRPGAYQGDLVTFLGLRSASSRLYYADDKKDAARSVAPLLWNLALRIEDGDVTLAASRLRDAQRELEQALQNPDATPEQIAQAMDNLKAAMMQYLAEMQKEMQKRLANGEIMAMPPDMLAATMDPDAMGKFLSEMEARLRAGDSKGAQEMLAQLQKLMDSMNAAMGMQAPPDMKFMSEGINKLQDLIRRQQELLDKTLVYAGGQRALQEDSLAPPIAEYLKQLGIQPPPVPQEPVPEVSADTQAEKKTQEEIRLSLGEIMLEADEKLHEIPKNMQDAEMVMRLSAKALSENKPGLSVPRQREALELLKQSTQEMSQRLMARLQQMGGVNLGGINYDPLGRPLGEGSDPGAFPGSNVKIPDQSARKRAEEILDLLRRRSGELERPPEELEYFRRLLRQF